MSVRDWKSGAHAKRGEGAPGSKRPRMSRKVKLASAVMGALLAGGSCP